MSKRGYLHLQRDLKRAEEALTDRLARIKAEASRSADDTLVAAVERMLAARHTQDWDEDIEDDFAGGTSGFDYAAPTMTWRSHLAELISRLNEDGYEENASTLRGLADKNSLKKPFTAADEAAVIKSILEYLTVFHDVHKEPPEDEQGPVEPDGFIWQGKTYRGLARKPFFAVRYLWTQPGKAVRTDKLGEPVWEDHRAIPDEEAVRGLRREINAFFREHKIPWHAAVKNQCLALCSGPPRKCKTENKPKGKTKPTKARKRAR